MKCKIRYNVFETNSSSTCSLVILSEEDAEKWEKEFELYVPKDSWGLAEKCKLYTKKDLLDIAKANDWEIKTEDDFAEFLCEEGFVTYEDWENIELEHDEEGFTTPGGEHIRIYSVYGNDY